MDLSANFIGKMSKKMFETFNNLQYLNLSHTNLSNFGFHTFYHLKNLRVLDLSYNRLGTVDFHLLFRNFKNLNTLNLEGNDLVQIDCVNRSNFPKLSFIGLSKNQFSCEYLARFLRQWDDLQVFHNPSDQTHIDGVDCMLGGQDSDLNEEGGTTEIMQTIGVSSQNFSTEELRSVTDASYTSSMETATETFSTSSSEAFSTISDDDVNGANMLTEESDLDHIEENKLVSQPSNTSTSYGLIELRIVECILILLCVCFVMKTKAIQRIKQKMKRKSLEKSITYREEKESQKAIVLID